MSEKQRALDNAQHARTELYETLALLGDQLNYAKRFDEAVDSAREDVKTYKRRNPLGFAVIAGSVALAVGAATWAGARVIIRRFGA